MKENEPCELLLRARALAAQRELEVAKLKCPFLDVCRGTTCFLFDPDTPNENDEIADDLRELQPIKNGKR
jgi:hypothetical protein